MFPPFFGVRFIYFTDRNASPLTAGSSMSTVCTQIYDNPRGKMRNTPTALCELSDSKNLTPTRIITALFLLAA